MRNPGPTPDRAENGHDDDAPAIPSAKAETPSARNEKRDGSVPAFYRVLTQHSNVERSDNVNQDYAGCLNHARCAFRQFCPPPSHGTRHAKLPRTAPHSEDTHTHTHLLPTAGRRAEVMASGSVEVSTSPGSSPIPSIMAVIGSERDAAHRLRSMGAIQGRLQSTSSPV